jgi:hypothetical protein
MEPLAELATLVTIPMTPIGTTGDWESVEQRLGIRLPDDYKQFVRLFGACTFGELIPIHVSSPFSRLNSLDAHIEGIGNGYRLMRKFGPLPFPVYPEPGGLLGWGNTDNGDYLNWLTIGDAENWPIVVWLNGDFERYEMGIVKFLTEVVSQRLKLFTSDMFPPPVKCIPSSDRPATV